MQANPVTALTPSAKIQLAGAIGSVLAFVVLLVGVLGTGNSPSSLVMWLAGLFIAAVSFLLLLAGTVRAAAVAAERKCLLPGVISLVACFVFWVIFFNLYAWFAARRIQHEYPKTPETAAVRIPHALS